MVDLSNSDDNGTRPRDSRPSIGHTKRPNQPGSQAIVFQPATGNNLFQCIVDQIENLIVNKKVRPGTRLPAERELVGQFQTGRGVIREALKELKQKGLIEIHKGAKGGAYVKELEIDEASEPLALMVKQRKIPLEMLIEFRESIDRTVTTLAIARATEDQVDRLLEMTDQLVVEARKSQPRLDKLSEIDRELNLLLGRMARNPMFEWIMRTIQLSIGSHDLVLYEDDSYREKTVRNWKRTAEEIAAREPLQALSYIGYHYVLLQRRIKEKKDGRRAGRNAGDRTPDRLV